MSACSLIWEEETPASKCSELPQTPLPNRPGAHELAAPPPLHKIFKFVSSSAPDSNIPFLTTLFPAWSGFSFLPELSKIQT